MWRLNFFAGNLEGNSDRHSPLCMRPNALCSCSPFRDELFDNLKIGFAFARACSRRGLSTYWRDIRDDIQKHTEYQHIPTLSCLAGVPTAGIH
jgi:hypothetical protein